MDKIVLGHGSGGKLMHELIREHFGPAFGIAGFGDSAILDMNPQKLAFTTDSYVVSPLFFPGGNIGSREWGDEKTAIVVNIGALAEEIEG